MYQKATTLTYTRMHSHIHLRQRTIPPHITQLSSAGMTDRPTTNLRHRNKRLTVLLAASNKRRHSCLVHRCFQNSSLISQARVGQRFPSSVFYRRNIDNASGPHLPPSRASSISARCTHLHSPPDSNDPAAATPTEWQRAPATRVLGCVAGWLALDFRHSRS